MSPRPEDNPWTRGKVAELDRRWRAGETASRIAAALGVGFTRSSVVAKARRLGLPGRPSPIKRDGAPDPYAKHRGSGQKRGRGELIAARQRSGTAQPAAAAPAESSPAYVPAPRKTSSRDACAWPIGDPRQPGFHFCGDQRVVLGKPYCLLHCRQAYRSPEEAARERAAQIKGRAA